MAEVNRFFSNLTAWGLRQSMGAIESHKVIPWHRGYSDTQMKSKYHKSPVATSCMRQLLVVAVSVCTCLALLAIQTMCRSNSSPAPPPAAAPTPLIHLHNPLPSTYASPAVWSEVSTKIDPDSLYNALGNINLWDLYPPTANCLDLVRLGKIGDGGKWVCGMGRSHPLPRVVMSFGVSDDLSFEADLLEWAYARTAAEGNAAGRAEGSAVDMRVFAFDPTIGTLPALSASQQHFLKHISFRKTALVSRQAAPASRAPHLMMETLPGLMRQHGVTLIDILKVDIEGAEWDVLGDLLGGEAGLNLSVGQLLVELHYKQSLAQVAAFFAAMHTAGFACVSREINLQPMTTGQPPLAAEYVFVNLRMFGAGGAVGEGGGLPATASLATFLPPAPPPIKAVIYLLTKKLRMASLIETLRLLHAHHLRDFPYPVALFHDDLNATDIAHLRASLPQYTPASLTLHKVAFSLPAHLAKAGVPEFTACAAGTSTLGYRHMCSFHTTGAHQALRAAGYADAEYIWRLDDDSFLTAPVGYDLFSLMRRHGKLYGFVNHLYDDPLCVNGLWNATRAFIQQAAQKGLINATAMADKDSEESFFGRLSESYTFYNNFEISHVSLWTSPIWRAYMAFIDKSGGIYTQRWGDAPLHTLGVSMLIGLDKLHRFADVAYTHTPFVNQSSSGIPPPGNHPLLSRKDYDCVYFGSWRCNSTGEGVGQGLANQRTGISFASSLPSRPAWSDAPPSPAPPPSPSTLFRKSRQWPLGHVSTASVGGASFSALRLNSSKDKDRNRDRDSDAKRPQPSEGSDVALFTFAHADREDQLEQLVATMSSFYLHLSPTYSIPFVILYNKAGRFSLRRLVHRLEQKHGTGTILSRTVGLSVAIPSFPAARDQEDEPVPGCLPDSGELRGASFFLRRGAAEALAKLGYQWLFRFGLESQLHTPLPAGFFAGLARDGVQFAYVSQFLDDSPCVRDLWAQADAFCLAYHPAASPAGSPGLTGCSLDFSSWPRHVIFLTSLEISRPELWNVPICQAFMAALERSPRHEQWGDAVIHTLCAQMALPRGQIRLLEGIVYESRIVPDTQGTLGTQGALPGLSLSSTSPPPAQLTLQSLPDIDRLFQPQRFGWLGGDVAASVYLPPLQRGGAGWPDKFLWLFGDSLVGTSTAAVRIEGKVVSNSVAVATRRGGAEHSQEQTRAQDQDLARGGSSSQKHKLQQAATGPRLAQFDVRYHWGQTASGVPREVLPMGASDLPPAMARIAGRNRSSSTLVFWPIGGISISSRYEAGGSGGARGTANAAKDTRGAHTTATEHGALATVRLVVVGPVVLTGPAYALGFFELASAMMLVLNPHDSPADWTIRRRVFAHTGQGERFKWVAMSQERGERAAEVVGGEDGTSVRDDWLYLYGIYSPGGFRHSEFDTFGMHSRREYQVMGRLKASSALRLDLDKLEVLYPAGAWQAMAAAAAGGEGGLLQPLMLFAPAVSEMSVHFDAAAQEWRAVSLRMMDARVRVCTLQGVAPGAFACLASLPLPPKWAGAQFNTYAAKAHPELLEARGNRSDTFVLSIVSNPVAGPGALFGQDKFRLAYCPRFYLVGPAGHVGPLLAA